MTTPNITIVESPVVVSINEFSTDTTIIEPINTIQVSGSDETSINVFVGNIGGGGSLFPGSVAEMQEAVSHWNSAYEWGNHSGLYSDLDHEHYSSVLVAAWSEAFGWGDHHGLYETIDPSIVRRTDQDALNWDVAFNWGNHATAGLFEPIDSTIVRYTDLDVCKWNMAFGWGDHQNLYSLLTHLHTGIYSPVGHTHVGLDQPPWETGDIDPEILVPLLNGAITQHQLSLTLNTKIDTATTGWEEANANFEQAIADFNSGMLAVDALDSRIEQEAGRITLSASRLDVVEGEIQTALIDIVDTGIRLTVSEGTINSHEARLVAQQSMSSSQWTVKIQENGDDGHYATGFGLLMYPDWITGKSYTEDTFVWKSPEVYKAKLNHTSNASNIPPNETYWELIPYGVKSQFGVLADSFFIQSASGDKKVPFLVQNGIVGIDGTLLVSGSIRAAALYASDVYSMNIESSNFVPDVSGYKLDAVNNSAEFNNIKLKLSYTDIDDAPQYYYQETTPTSANKGDIWIVPSTKMMYTFNGSTWVAGKPGDGGISCVLSNESHTFPAAADGTVSSYTGGGTSIDVYAGASPLTYDGIGTSPGTWKIASRSTVNISYGSLTDFGNYVVTGVPNSMGLAIDTASITYIITGKNLSDTSFTITKTQSFSKSKTGVNGLPGPLLTVTASNHAFLFTDKTIVVGQAPIVLTAVKQNTAEVVTWTSVPDLINGTGNTKSLTAAVFDAGTIWYRQVTITATTPSGLSDTISILRLEQSDFALNPAGRVNEHTVTIDGGKLTAYSITADRIVANSITAGQINVASIQAAVITANAIKVGHIDADTITVREINDGAVETPIIKANAVTSSMTASGTYTTGMNFSFAAPAGEWAEVIIICSLIQMEDGMAMAMKIDFVAQWTAAPIRYTLVSKSYSATLQANRNYWISFGSSGYLATEATIFAMVTKR